MGISKSFAFHQWKENNKKVGLTTENLDWHMFLTAGQLGLNVNARLLGMGFPSAAYEWHDMLSAVR